MRSADVRIHRIAAHCITTSQYSMFLRRPQNYDSLSADKKVSTFVWYNIIITLSGWSARRVTMTNGVITAVTVTRQVTAGDSY